MERDNYPALAGNPSLIHLDVSASFPLHKSVIEAANRAMMLVGVPGKGDYSGAGRSAQLVDDVRREVADFLNVSSDEIYFCHSASRAIYDTVASLAGAADCVIFSPEDHISNVQVALTSGLAPIRLNYTETGVYNAYDLDKNYSLNGYENSKLSTPNRALFLATHIHQLYGTDTGFLDIIKNIRPWFVALDISQSVARVPIDLGSMPVDVAYFSAQKVGGMAGVGVLYIKRQSRQKIEGAKPCNTPKLGLGDNKITGLLPNITIEPNTLPLVPIASLGAAIKLLRQQNMLTIYHHLADLTSDTVLPALAGMPNIHPAKGAAMVDIACKGYGIVSFMVDGYQARDVGMILDDCGVNVRAGGHCTIDETGKDLVRLSWHMFTEQAELLRALEIIKNL